MSNIMLAKVNAGLAALARPAVAPVMATPAAFVAGVVAGAKAACILVGAAGVGVAAANALK